MSTDSVCELESIASVEDEFPTIRHDEGDAFVVHGGVIEVVGKRRSLRIDNERRLIGRAPGCALVVEDRTVSALHLEVQATPDGVRVVDLDSSNGTFLCPDEVRIARAFLRRPCELRCAAQRLRFWPTAPLSIPSFRVERLGGLVGSTPEMLALFAVLRRCANSPMSVLIRGETGTGKERVARAIHDASSRRNEPFEALNSAAVPDNLLEAELFGSVAGAFTGAVTRDGRFLEAHGGTLFFDEVAEMSPAMQAKLLRVLQDAEIRPLGGRRSRRVDVRTLFATNVDLCKAVNDGRFRSDLYFRIAQVSVEVPPLRKRLDDLEVLVADILRDLAGRLNLPLGLRVDQASMATLRSHHWPGNVRELETVLQRAALGVEGGLLSVDKPSLLAGSVPGPAHRERPYQVAKTEFDLEYYLPLYVAYSGNVTRIAQTAGRDRATVRSALLELGLRV